MPREGEGEDFDVKLTDEELESSMDVDDAIRYEEVRAFFLTNSDGEEYFEWIVAWIRSYRTYMIRSQEYKPRYYKTQVNKVVLGSNIARFFGVQVARILRDFFSIEDTWSIQEIMFDKGICTESMSVSTFPDINRCNHFADD